MLVGKEIRTLRPGQKAGIPRKTSIASATPQRSRPGSSSSYGHAGLEKALVVGYSLVAENNGTLRNPYHLALLLEWSDIRFPGSLFTMALIYLTHPEIALCWPHTLASSWKMRLSDAAGCTLWHHFLERESTIKEKASCPLRALSGGVG